MPFHYTNAIKNEMYFTFPIVSCAFYQPTILNIVNKCNKSFVPKFGLRKIKFSDNFMVKGFAK